MGSSQLFTSEPFLNSFFLLTDYCYVPAALAVHLRRQNLASRNRVFSYLWCFDVENLEVGWKVYWTAWKFQEKRTYILITHHEHIAVTRMKLLNLGEETLFTELLSNEQKFNQNWKQLKRKLKFCGIRKAWGIKVEWNWVRKKMEMKMHFEAQNSFLLNFLLTARNFL